MEQKVGISLCVRGSAVRVAGSRLCRVSRGTVMIVSPALPTIDIERSDDFGELTVVELMGAVAGETTPFFSRMMPRINASKPCARLDEERTVQVAAAAERILERERLDPSTDLFRQMNEHVARLMRLTLILEMLYEIASQASPADETGSRGEQVFVHFMQSLVGDYAERRSVADYAADASLSVRHFSHLVSRHTGQTPKQWITGITLGMAKSMLRSTNLSVKEISDRLGFPEQFTFRKYFKKNAGVSPTEYRRAGGPA